MQNIMGLIWSMVYIFLILGLATVVARISKGASETSRKLVHILVGNWVILTPMFTQLWAVVLVPFTFIIINSLSLKYKLISAMERNDDSLGTVYYAVSLFVLSGGGFLLGWKTLPFIGLLTMAYGDGLAAIIGKKWGKRKPFTFAWEKSIAGSLTVAIAAFIVTATCLYIFGSAETQRDVSIPAILLISALTGILSAFIELTGKKGCDNLTLPIGSGLFASLCLHYGNVGLYIYLLISVAILLAAYQMRALTPDGIVAAILTAITLYALGGVWIGIGLLTFFVLGSAASRLKNERKRIAEARQEEGGARNWKQVLCNSLPACVLLWLALFLPDQKFLVLLSFAVFSAAAADTFSSEIGMLSKGKVFNILNGKPIQSGVSGGVSWAGLGAGVLGSLLLSLLALPQFGWSGVAFVSVLGFIGSILDSILGSVFQRKYLGKQGQLQDKPNYINEKPAAGLRLMTNNAVNLLSLSVVSCCGHFVYSIMIRV
ncbi:MAG: DUF92 domain-containing protein [Bacteroidia bacterium]|nr:DUF92 domain-containing protein [Bacteroidia bacterium]